MTVFPWVKPFILHDVCPLAPHSTDPISSDLHDRSYIGGNQYPKQKPVNLNYGFSLQNK